MTFQGEISLHEFRVNLEREASQGFLDGLGIFMDAAADEFEERVRTNIEARFSMRSRALWSSVRSDIEGTSDQVQVTLEVGGEHEGLRVPYAHIQEEGGIIRAKDKLLTIPLSPALTGPEGREQPKYPRASLAPYLEWRPVGDDGTDGPRGVLVHAQTGEVWYVLTPKVEITGKYFVRDAVESVKAELPDQLLGFLEGRLAELGGPA